MDEQTQHHRNAEYESLTFEEEGERGNRTYPEDKRDDHPRQAIGFHPLIEKGVAHGTGNAGVHEECVEADRFCRVIHCPLALQEWLGVSSTSVALPTLPFLL